MNKKAEFKDIRGISVYNGDTLRNTKGVGNEFVVNTDSKYQMNHLSYFSKDYVIVKYDYNNKRFIKKGEKE